MSNSLENQTVIQKVACQGDLAWEDFLEKAEQENKFPDGIPSANAMARNFSVYHGKYMSFVEIDFNKSISDKQGVKYFLSENIKYKGFILQFCPELIEKLRKYSVLLGKIGLEDWEVIGEISDFYSSWNNYVFVKLRALKVKDKFAAFFTEDEDNVKAELVGEDILLEELQKLESADSDEIPVGLKEIPAGADPLLIARLFYQLSIVEDNMDLWIKLYTKANQGRASMLKSQYNGVRKNERKYFHVKTDIDEDNKNKYFFQMKLDGEYIGTPKPLTIVKDTDGEWRIGSASI